MQQAHWFDMPKFWAAAADVLRPGGTVALWTGFREVVGMSWTHIQHDPAYRHMLTRGLL